MKFNPGAYADIESSNVPSLLAAATTEEVNPVYDNRDLGDENANDIQPYAEVMILFYFINLP